MPNLFDDLRWPGCPSRLRAASLHADIAAVLNHDPSCSSRSEAFLMPGVHALWFHRIARRQQLAGRPLLARVIASAGRVLTGIDIHPGATISPGVFIDHGHGVIIGETAVVEEGVVMFHRVTLGSLGPRGYPAIGRRHPIVRASAVIGAGASVLGAVEVGAGAFIGAHAVVLADVPARTRVPAGVIHRRINGVAEPLPRLNTGPAQ